MGADPGYRVMVGAGCEVEQSCCDANQEIRSFQADCGDSSLYGAAFSGWKRIRSRSAGLGIWFDQRWN
jgi:hypothetical protein